MLLDKQLFLQITEKATESPRLRMNFDLRDSEDEGCQRMLNVLLPGSKTPIHRHLDSSEVAVCLSGSVKEHFYDDNGVETGFVTLSSNSDIPAIVIELGRYRSLEATDEIGVICSMQADNYSESKTDVID